MLQPKLKSKVRCTDLDIGEVTKVVLDPLSHEISHIVVSMNGSGERQIAMGHVQAVTEDVVQLRAPSRDILALPPFKREDYVTTHEVEISHLEDTAVLRTSSSTRSTSRVSVAITFALYAAGSLVNSSGSFPVMVLSAGPGTRPIGDFRIDLPRPRDVSEIRMTPAFLALHREIWAAMKEEVLKAYERQRAA